MKVKRENMATGTTVEVIPCEAARRGFCVRQGELAGMCGAPDPEHGLDLCHVAHTDLTSHIGAPLTVITDGERLAQAYRNNVLLRQIHAGTITVHNEQTPNFGLPE